MTAWVLAGVLLVSGEASRAEVLGADGRRTGTIVERSPGYFDLLDRDSRRLGWGRRSSFDPGRIEFFDRQGRRLFEIRRDRPPAGRR